MDPTFNGLMFYFWNMVIVAGYLYVSLIFAFANNNFTVGLYRWEPEVPADARFYNLKRFLRWMSMHRIRLSGLVFFFLCGMTHIELAAHSAMGVPIMQNGAMPWHMHLIHIPQGLSVWIFVTSLVKKHVPGAPKYVRTKKVWFRLSRQKAQSTHPYPNGHQE